MMYYYFKSKEEILIPYVEQTYQDIIDNCQKIALFNERNALKN